MPVIAYLNFKGNCREAVEHYADVFGLEIPKIMTFGEMAPNPEFPVPEEVKDWVLHTMLMINGSPVMFSDVFPHSPFIVGNNISLSLNGHNEEELTNWFHKLKVGGQVGMELQQTFWSKLYGMVTDKFGIVWQLNLENTEA